MLWISFISLFRATLNCFFSPMVSTQERFCFDDLSSAAIYCQLDSANANPIGDWREAEKWFWSLYFSSIIPVESPRLLWLLGESHCGSFMQPSPSNCSLWPTHQTTVMSPGLWYYPLWSLCHFPIFVNGPLLTFHQIVLIKLPLVPH